MAEMILQEAAKPTAMEVLTNGNVYKIQLWLFARAWKILSVIGFRQKTVKSRKKRKEEKGRSEAAK